MNAKFFDSSCLLTCWTATRLDYMMLSRRARETLRVQSLLTLEWDASDHKPLVCDLEM